MTNENNGWKERANIWFRDEEFDGKCINGFAGNLSKNVQRQDGDRYVIPNAIEAGLDALFESREWVRDRKLEHLPKLNKRVDRVFNR
jgi:hypothetical protein